jgi:hypothetical protein
MNINELRFKKGKLPELYKAIESINLEGYFEIKVDANSIIYTQYLEEYDEDFENLNWFICIDKGFFISFVAETKFQQIKSVYKVNKQTLLECYNEEFN